MKKFFLLLTVSISLLLSSNAQSSLFDKAKKAVSGGNQGAGSGLSNDEIINGLKEALSLGAQKSAGRLSVVDGFFKDAVVKILLPPEAQKVERALRNIGMGNLVDDAILRMNRAAEDASKSAAPIFVNAVKKMSVSDALGILRGPDTAATSYLKKTTAAQLTASFKPVIDSSLQKTDATKYWKTVFQTYNELPTTFKKVDPDLSSYVTQKALSGIFYYVAQEEVKIRKDPAAQVTDLLKKVFGGK
ncbi:MAG: DUF4197 domain-containing protein [Bacteroidetes bacterium]|nr:DUF4197 domain-containing protein [Bacteroidota bacterium]MBS1973383.1 DUF4197 domain-containing protein [Bacteroidota bacterium]